jgi:hypothetical protein
MGGLPTTVVADVFHRAWTCAALLHRAFLRPWLQQLHARRRHPAGFAGNLEQPGLSGFPLQPGIRCSPGALSELRNAMEPLSLVIPTFNEAEVIGSVIHEVLAAYRLDIIVADGGSTDWAQRIARAAGKRVIDAGIATAAPDRRRCDVQGEVPA